MPIKSFNPSSMLNDKAIPIDYMAFQKQLQIRKQEGKMQVFDPIRKKHIVLTPEETVRQLVIHYLIEDRKFNKSRISVEKKLLVNGLDKRFDLLIYDAAVRPYLLIECKSPEISIRQEVFEQISRYNLALQVPYLMVTNGLTTFCCQIHYEEGSYDFLSDLPSSQV